MCFQTTPSTVAKLPQSIQLDHEAHWEVALVEIIHLIEVYNINENQGEFWVTILNKTVQNRLEKLDPGLYEEKKTIPWQFKTQSVQIENYRTVAPVLKPVVTRRLHFLKDAALTHGKEFPQNVLID